MSLKYLIKHIMCVCPIVYECWLAFVLAVFLIAESNMLAWCQALLWRYCQVSLQGAHSKLGTRRV